MPFKFLEDVAIADSAFEARGKTLNELFESSALATMDVMANVKTIKPRVKKAIELKSESIDTLLFDFLEEIVYIKDKDSFIFSKLKVSVTDADKKIKKLKAVLHGEKIDYRKHDMRRDVKAVTMHMFSVRKDKKGWTSTVVLDI